MHSTFQTIDIAGYGIQVQLYEDAPKIWLALGYIAGAPILVRDRGKRAVVKRWQDAARLAAAQAASADCSTVRDEACNTPPAAAAAEPSDDRGEYLVPEAIPTDPHAPVARDIDAFHWHEAMHTASIVADMFDRHLAEHPAVKADPDLSARADQLEADLRAFYQLIGQRRPD